MHPKELVIEKYLTRFGKSPDFLGLAPGRVNILGEHVDYNDGFVMPVAIDRATYVAFSLADNPSNRSVLVAADYSEEITFDFKGLLTKTDCNQLPFPEWAYYPASVAWALSTINLTAPPINAVYASDIPRGASLSSSASVEMAFMIAFQTLGGWALPPIQRALLGQKGENKYVGVNCGIMDQFASACGTANRLLLLDCRSLDWQTLAISEDLSIVVADTSIRRKLTSSGYNDRRDACEEAVKILSRFLPDIKALRDVSLEDFNHYCHYLSPIVEKRSRHVVEEIERSLEAIILLEQGKIREFGQIMNKCHDSLRDLFEVSIPELNTMVEIAQALPGCIGARLTGAGFGGCTVNLVETNQVNTFATEIAIRYLEQTKLMPEIYICKASDGARLL